METVEAHFPDKLRELFEPRRYKVLYGGRGGAKSWGVARALLIEGASKPIRVLCAREYQNSIRDSVHKLLSDQINELCLSGFYEIQTASIRGRNGTEFAFEGLKHNVTKIKSYEGVDRAWVEEAQTVSKQSWDILIPTIRKTGSEIWLTFNPEFEDDETYQRFVVSPPGDAAVIEMSWRDNPWFPEVLERERLELMERDRDSYDHVWEGKCRQWLDGAIFANELRDAYEAGRITEVPYDPDVLVHTAWDIGRTDDTAIWWFQVVGGEIHIIESYARSGGDPAHFASAILGREVGIDIVGGELEVATGKDIDGLAHRRRYEYGTHWLPHDARAKRFEAAGKSTQQQLTEALGDNVRIVHELSREDGIKVARSAFPRCWFDKDGTVEGLKALRKYRRELQRDEVSLRATPVHDWTSHYADAFRYLAIAWEEDPAPAKIVEPPRDAWGRFRDEGSWKTA